MVPQFRSHQTNFPVKEFYFWVYVFFSFRRFIAFEITWTTGTRKRKQVSIIQEDCGHEFMCPS